MTKAHERIVVLILCFLVVPALRAQSEQNLQEFFEGQRVAVKLDMPADKSGVDIYVGAPHPVKFSEVGDRLKQYGIALRKGDSTTVTKIKVNKRNIEFQLGGGGFGTLSDMSSAPSVSTYVPKSKREKRIENDVKSETDSAKKRRLEEELDDLRQQRRREEARLQAEASQAQSLARSQERAVRAQAGSRFNLWYQPNIPSEALSPESVIQVLSAFLEFPDAQESREDDPISPSGSASPQRSQFPSGYQSPMALHKGMNEEEVGHLFGEPETRKVEQLGEFKVVNSVFTTPDARLWTQFVEGVLVKYTLAAK